MLSNKVKKEFRWICPVHQKDLMSGNEAFLCPDGCQYPIRNEIPRFVPPDNYAASFGLQWNEYRTTQLDSYTGTSISKDRLTRMFGGSMSVVNGKKVLEAGCGAGRFSEVLLAAGADLTAIDLSSAVTANYKNCSKFPNYEIAQASILALPFADEQFDIVVCVGVVQHTPDPEKTMEALIRQLKPGGLLVIDHYTYGYAMTPSRTLLRNFFLRHPGTLPLRICKLLTAILWPLHRLFWFFNRLPLLHRLRPAFVRLSPLLDYHEAYPQLGPRLLKIWAALDTHDTLTDFYKHLRSTDEIRAHLQKCGMQDIQTAYAGNGVEARSIKVVNSMALNIPVGEGLS